MKEKRWKPENCEMYWYVWHDGHVYWGDFTGSSDERHFKFGNCFKTKAEAAAAAEKVKALLLSLHDKMVTDCNQLAQPTTNSSQLPKLTAEVFDRPDCPVWAKYAAVDGCGRGFYYEAFPRLYKRDRFFLLSTIYGKTQRIPGKFDGKNWINSIVIRQDRPFLPDWCKAGKWVWDKRNGYGKIKSVRDDRSACYIEFDGGAGDFVPEALAELTLARLRPYNAEEMKALVGKIVCDTDGNNELITGWSVDMEKVRICSIYYSAQRLLDGKFTIDGKPCGILEHLENGEWVK